MANYLEKIREGKYTLLIRKNKRIIFKSNDFGIKGLVRAFKRGFLKGAIVYDKTVGLAVAKIAVFSKAKELNALLASSLAINFCQKEKFPLKAEKIVDKIYDLEFKNECYLEKMAKKTDNPQELISHFENIYETENSGQD